MMSIKNARPVRDEILVVVFYQDVVPNGTGIFGKTTKPLNRY
jgi:hypothetical protein